MSTSSLFTETPIEAALWSFSVSLQERLAVSLFQTSYFKGAVSLYMGFVVARGLWRWGLGRELGGWVWVGSKLLCCFLGLAFLNRLSSQPFSPQMESGASWASKAPSPHKGGLGPPAHGLQFYRMAALYTKVSVFLPAIRGFAKGILALMFLVASARMAFGSVGLMVSWGWGLLLITAYEPLSTFLYQATLTLTQSPETLGALGALKNDPLAVVGAQVMDSYASRVQATYFVLQLGLTALTAAGGLAVFRYQRALGGGLAGVVANKGLGMVRNLALIKAGGVGAVAASKVEGKS